MELLFDCAYHKQVNFREFGGSSTFGIPISTDPPCGVSDTGDLYAPTSKYNSITFRWWFGIYTISRSKKPLGAQLAIPFGPEGGIFIGGYLAPSSQSHIPLPPGRSE